jgi:Zn finger protein HypA/HybF involved in hydrogenase expression
VSADPTATPWWLVVLVLAIPVAVTGIVGALAFRRMTPLLYRCRRCSGEFRRAAHRRFPVACPRCRARDWSTEPHRSDADQK